jgi:hypothetical protein
MDIVSSFIIIAVAGLIHASFQLSISMLTLLSSHTVGRKRSNSRLLLLTNSFVFGAAVMTMLLLSFGALLLGHLVNGTSSYMLAWTISCGILGGVGISVWIFYYRRETGTTLWVPRALARHLSGRTKATKQSGEAFSLGLTSVIGELLFILAPITVAALILIQLEPLWQLAGLLTYTGISLASLLVVNGLIGSGHSISRIQKWRESNKGFLQMTAGSGLLILSFYIYVNEVLTVTVMAAAGAV